MKMKKKGQMTIFIIVGVLIVALIAGYFLFRSGKLPWIGGKGEDDPQGYMQSCIEEDLRETIETISMQGGYLENKLNKRFRFDDESTATNISYLCYNQNNYLPCVNQEPVLMNHLADEIHEGVEDVMQDCFDTLSRNIEDSGSVVNARYNGFEVKLRPGKIELEIDGSLTVTSGDETTEHSELGISVATKFYDLAVVVQEIVSQEAEYCNFEYLGFMVLYPQFDIDKFKTGDSTTIYTVGHKNSEEKFRFAVRSCVIPPGF
jgi:hypothetical protein